MSVIAPKEKDDIEVQFDHSQIYLYELDANKTPSKRPRHCLPYAVVSWTKLNDGTEWPLSFTEPDLIVHNGAEKLNGNGNGLNDHAESDHEQESAAQNEVAKTNGVEHEPEQAEVKTEPSVVENTEPVESSTTEIPSLKQEKVEAEVNEPENNEAASETAINEANVGTVENQASLEPANTQELKVETEINSASSVGELALAQTMSPSATTDATASNLGNYEILLN